MKTIIFILISTLLFSCKCPPSAEEPQSISFFFSLIDHDGNDLFFGENGIYDPYNVKFAVRQESEFPQNLFYIYEKCFALRDFYPKENPYVFFMGSRQHFLINYSILRTLSCDCKIDFRYIYIK